MKQTSEDVKQKEEFGPEMREKIIEGMNTPLDDCVEEKDVEW